MVQKASSPELVEMVEIIARHFFCGSLSLILIVLKDLCTHIPEIDQLFFLRTNNIPLFQVKLPFLTYQGVYRLLLSNVGKYAQANSTIFIEQMGGAVVGERIQAFLQDEKKRGAFIRSLA